MTTPQTPPDAVLDAFREQLHPAALTTRFTGTSVAPVPAPPLGRAGFDAWVEQRLAEVLADRYPVGGRPAFVVLVDGTDGLRWRWDDDPCSQSDWFAGRVARELDHVVAPTLLGAELRHPEPSWEGFDPATGEWEEWSEPRWVDPTGTLVWYAEARRPDVAAVRAGVVELRREPDGREVVTGRREVAPRSRRDVAGFARVLRGHEARRRHRLR